MMKRNQYNLLKNFFFGFLGLFIILKAYNTWAYKPGDCIKCHREGGTGSTFHISIKEFEASIHGREITCQNCHTGIKDEEHENIKGSGAVDCIQCHEQKDTHGLKSKSKNRPQCHTCHTKHKILGKDNVACSVHPEQLKETCKGCHPVECGKTDYFSWLPSIQIMSHKKQDLSKAYDRNNCLGCHQGQAAHGETEPLNDQNCHVCHLNVKDRAKLMGYIHPRADPEKQPDIFAAATIYQIFIIVLFWGGFKFYILKLSGKFKKRKE